MFNEQEELSALARSVVRDDETDTVVLTVARGYTAEADEVWDAITRPERLERWFLPVTGTLELGGTFQLEGNAGGDIRHCERPRALQVTFGGPDSILDVTLHQVERTTTVALTHTVPLAMAGSGAGALFVGPGWDGALMGLGLYLRGVPFGDPREAANSPEVIDFNRASIDSWTKTVRESGSATEAEISGGRDAAIAQYTVLPE